MTIQVTLNNGKVTIFGDGLLLAKLPHDFDAATVDLGNTRIDADNLSIAANAAFARSSDINSLKHYAALRTKFLEQQNADINE